MKLIISYDWFLPLSLTKVEIELGNLEEVEWWVAVVLAPAPVLSPSSLQSTFLGLFQLPGFTWQTIFSNYKKFILIMGFEFDRYDIFFRTKRTRQCTLHFSLHFHSTLHCTSLKTIKGNKTWTPFFSLRLAYKTM